MTRVNPLVCVCVLSVVMGKEQQENKRAIHNTQHELSQQSAVRVHTHLSYCPCKDLTLTR